MHIPARGAALVVAGSPFGALSPRHYAGSVAAGVVSNVVLAEQVRCRGALRACTCICEASSRACDCQHPALE